jgi:hypothetical protein
MGVPEAAGRRHDAADEVVECTAEAFRALLDGGWSVPLPGAGATLTRWRALAAIAARDLPLARLAEGHADAVGGARRARRAIGPARRPAGRVGGRAAGPPVIATASPDGRRSSGRKQW